MCPVVFGCHCSDVHCPTRMQCRFQMSLIVSLQVRIYPAKVRRLSLRTPLRVPVLMSVVRVWSRCMCENAARCDHVTGDCHCSPGWTGEDCSQTCRPGYWGVECREVNDVYLYQSYTPRRRCILSVQTVPVSLTYSVEIC